MRRFRLTVGILVGLLVIAGIVVGILYATGVLGKKGTSSSGASQIPLGPGGTQPLIGPDGKQWSPIELGVYGTYTASNGTVRANYQIQRGPPANSGAEQFQIRETFNVTCNNGSTRTFQREIPISSYSPTGQLTDAFYLPDKYTGCDSIKSISVNAFAFFFIDGQWVAGPAAQSPSFNMN